jgi:hypothetical protein
MTGRVTKPGIILLLAVAAAAQHSHTDPPASPVARYDGADWHLKGEGVVCCPCPTPCPCRTNGAATYGHCERTLFVQLKDGHYGDTSLKGLKWVNTGGACAANYTMRSASYFDVSSTPEQRTAFMKVFASFYPAGTAGFPYVRIAPIRYEASAGGRLRVIIPNILEMEVDRNWGQASPPFAMTAGVDPLSNAVQFIENIRYKMHDPDAKLDFDYSRRQANYRVVDLDVSQYRSKSMLFQHEDGTGWFNETQLGLIKQQGLELPDLDAIRKKAAGLKRAGSRQ